MKDRQEMSWLLKAILEYYRVIWKTVERGKVDGYRKGARDGEAGGLLVAVGVDSHSRFRIPEGTDV